MEKTFRVNGIFSDHMVLQRNKEVPVWGTGQEGERIVVECQGHRAKTVVRDGRWQVMLPPMDAGGPYELTVTSESDTVVYKDVLFGDVWLAGGQSNMEWRLADSAEAKADIPLADDSSLRYYDVPKVAYDDGSMHRASWKLCTPERAPHFSAVAYYFAKRVRQDIDVPIGIIGCNWGGTSASCWLDEASLAGDPDLRVYIDEFAYKLKDFNWDEFEAANRRYNEAVAQYVRKQADGMEGEELGNFPWPPPLSPRSFMRPGGLYGTMLRKAVPYALKGSLFYQGESDADKPLIYDKLLETMIRRWRTDWNDHELPFLFVQLTSYGCDGDPDGDAWPLLRESQQIIADRVPGAAMAVTYDCGDTDDIHPKRKKPVGERLALLALNHVYGRDDVISSGPVFAGMDIEGNKALLRFEHFGAGLAVSGNALIGFEVCGEEGRYVPAHAVIEGDIVAVFSEQVPVPAAVRYAWANDTKANLTNGIGLPAAPFRTTPRR